VVVCRKMLERDLLIADLRAALGKARALSVEALASQIREIGFECLGCGECCSGEDNSVVVFPVEVRRILEATGLHWLEVAVPPDMGEWEC